MSREWSRNKKIDRKSWGPGPWDGEPDFYEWTTAPGYEAYAYRLNSGAWAAAITAPRPKDSKMFHSFMNEFMHSRKEFKPGLVTNARPLGLTEFDYFQEMSEFHLSMEHYDAPMPDPRDAHRGTRGPYITLERLKGIVEDVALDIRDKNEEFENRLLFSDEVLDKVIRGEHPRLPSRPDLDFECPRCGGSYFTAHHDSTKNQYWCRDEFGRGCKWTGEGDDYFTPSRELLARALKRANEKLRNK